MVVEDPFATATRRGQVYGMPLPSARAGGVGGILADDDPEAVLSSNYESAEAPLFREW